MALADDSDGFDLMACRRSGDANEKLLDLNFFRGKVSSRIGSVDKSILNNVFNSKSFRSCGLSNSACLNSTAEPGLIKPRTGFARNCFPVMGLVEPLVRW